MENQTRKLTRRKIELGEIVIKAGLGNWDNKTLVAAFEKISKETKPSKQ